MNARIWTLFSLALALATGTPGLDAQTREITPGGLYPAGTVLASPLTGITLRLPDGFRAEWDPGLGGLLALSNDGAFGGVWGWSEGSVEDVVSEIGQRLAALGFELQVRGDPELTAEHMRAEFDVMSTDGQGVLHAMVRRGPHGAVVAVAGLGEPLVEARAESFVEDVSSSLEWSPAGAAAWRQEVVGALLTRGSGGSDVSGGVTAATGASSSSATLAFCSATRYQYRESSEPYVSIPGASTSSTSSDEHAGQWWLVADLSGVPALFLEATDGRVFQWTVQESGDGFVIDGYRYTVTGQC